MQSKSHARFLFYRAIVYVERLADKSHFLNLLVMLAIFVPARILFSSRYGISPVGDGAETTATKLSEVWTGNLSLAGFFSDGGVLNYLENRPTQLAYPLLVSLYGPLHFDIETYLIILHTFLGSVMVVGSYLTAVHLHSNLLGLITGFLAISLFNLYWIACFAVVDNLFYAVIPLVALSIVMYLRKNSRKNVAVLIFSSVLLMVSRPEGAMIFLSLLVFLAWLHFKNHFSWKTIASCAVVIGLVISGSVMFSLQNSPNLERRILSSFHVAWGLAASSNTLFNRGGHEFDKVQAYYADLSREVRNPRELRYRMSQDALAQIKENPLWFGIKIPLRALGFLFPWAYQPWSLRHILYEATYTLFVVVGVFLLASRREVVSKPDNFALLLIPLSVLFFLSVYGIDNDLKHRNGILVGLNLIAPMGYATYVRRSPASVRLRSTDG